MNFDLRRRSSRGPDGPHPAPESICSSPGLAGPLARHPRTRRSASGKTIRRALAWNWIGILAAGLWVIGCSKQSATEQPEATMDELNRAARAWGMINPAPLVHVSDLTNFPTLHGKRLPTPEAGKKLAIDPRTRQVIIVDDR